QCFETGTDQLNGTAAQNSLFAEQVSFCFFAEVGFDDTGTAAAVSRSVRQSDVTCSTGFVLINSNQVRNTAALRVSTAHCVARSLGRNHDDVDVIARNDLAVMHVEAVCESQCSASLDVGSNLLVVYLGNVFVRQQHHDNISALDGFSHFLHLQT